MAVDGFDAGNPRWAAMLDGDERARAARFRFARHRQQFVAAHVLARLVCARLSGGDPAGLRFARDPAGKPRLVAPPGAQNLAFSLSHTEGWVGLAAGAAPRRIGFDLEAHERPGTLDFLADLLDPRERAALAGLDEPARRERMLALWTLREALLKARGTGLADGLGGLCFATDPPRLLATGAADGTAWHFAQRQGAGAWTAALAYDLGEAAVAWHTVDARLLAERAIVAGC